MFISEINSFKDKIENIKFTINDLNPKDKDFLDHLKDNAFFLTIEHDNFSIFPSNENISKFKFPQRINLKIEESNSDLNDYIIKGYRIVIFITSIAKDKNLVFANLYPFSEIHEFDDLYISLNDQVSKSFRMKSIKFDYDKLNTNNISLQNNDSTQVAQSLNNNLDDLDNSDEQDDFDELDDLDDFDELDDLDELDDQKYNKYKKGHKTRTNKIKHDNKKSTNKIKHEKKQKSLASYINFKIDNELYYLIEIAEYQFSLENEKNNYNQVEDLSLHQPNELISDQQTSNEDSDDFELPDFIKDGISNKRSNKDTNTIKQNSITLISSKFRLVLRSIDLSNGDPFSEENILEASKCIFKPDNNKKHYILCKGKLNFVKDQISAKTSNLVKSTIDYLLENKISYIDRWKKYGLCEFKNYLHNSYLFGFAKIVSVNTFATGYSIYLDKQVDLSKANNEDEIIISSSLPSFYKINSTDLLDPDGNIRSDIDIDQIIREFNLNKQNSIYSRTGTSFAIKLGNQPRSSFQIEITSNNPITPPQVGDYVFLSVTGNLVQHQRREIALGMILNQQCGIKHLGAIIEDSEKLDQSLNSLFSNSQRSKSKKIKPLTDRIRKKIFSRNPPTQTQIDAIDLAINTPDIALIQGPPGTGKTTVITAIIERISELMATNKKDNHGSILISGFQHDAVENIIERLSVNSLPVVKFGEKRGDELLDTSTLHRIENWANEIIEQIKAKHPSIVKSEAQKKFDLIKIGYETNPTEENEKALLRWVINCKSTNVQSLCASKAQEYLAKLELIGSDETQSVILAINNIRTTEHALFDDGLEKVGEFFNLISKTDYEDLLEPSDRDLLNKIYTIKPNSLSSDDLKSFLSQIKLIKNKLLKATLAIPIYIQPKPKKNILELCQDVNVALIQDNQDLNSEENKILLDFISDLEFNPIDLIKTINQYQLVYSATTQQSVGNKILQAKGITIDRDDPNNLEFPTYDTVIIDEAARANPLDLLIPMVQATKRIVLVGDHRQLPQMIEDDIVKQVLHDSSVDADKIQYDFYSTSMFEYLFSRLNRLEQLDGNKRTITLDAQYRTHPILGKYCSDNFYSIHNLSEAYDSPLGEQFFIQSLKAIDGKCCGWFNVSNESSPMETNSKKSKYRSKEAEVCSKLLKNWLSDPSTDPNLSFGIITFYSAQVEKIYEFLEQYGIAEKNVNGKFKILEEYRYLPNGKERIRIGSVDAFQGMEFDIVLLSLVRSYSPQELKSKKDVVGFLALENRLCVSMSRQKRFLGIVGDRDYACSDAVVSKVKSLKNFSDLCTKYGCSYSVK